MVWFCELLNFRFNLFDGYEVCSHYPWLSCCFWGIGWFPLSYWILDAKFVVFFYLVNDYWICSNIPYFKLILVICVFSFIGYFFWKIIDFITLKKRLSVMILLLHTFYFIDCSCILYYFFSSALFMYNWLFFFYIHKVKA